MRFWKAIVKSIPTVLSNSKWIVRDGNISFWYDNWDEDGPIHDHYTVIDKPLLKIKDCRIDNGWDTHLLESLVGHQKANDLVHFFTTRKEGQDVLIWKNDRDGKFNTKCAWDCVRVRVPVLPWAQWIWHASLPKKIYVLMCAYGFFSYLAGASFWFHRVGHSSHIRIIFSLIPSIVSWKLWDRRCKARFDGKVETAVSIWKGIKFWIRHILNVSMNSLTLSQWDGDILRRLDIPVLPPQPKKVNLVKWLRPQQGWVKLNTDGSSLGNLGSAGVGGFIRDASGQLCLAYSMDIGKGF
ncbi:hypothetical protein I3760_09G127500 [Carya illinoinensis]|nr:hypothetical protein I3760_09G127500 [Carya illinoinensis]